VELIEDDLLEQKALLDLVRANENDRLVLPDGVQHDEVPDRLQYGNRDIDERILHGKEGQAGANLPVDQRERQ
jgi:hypothetical protein